MTDKFIAREKRKRQAQKRLGTTKPRCLCGETNPHCFDAHHIAQRRFDGTTVDVCKNCHAKGTDLQKDHPWPLDGELTPQERFAHMLYGLADLLLLAVDKIIEIADWLVNEARTFIEKQNSQQAQ